MNKLQSFYRTVAEFYFSDGCGPINALFTRPVSNANKRRLQIRTRTTNERPKTTRRAMKNCRLLLQQLREDIARFLL